MKCHRVIASAALLLVAGCAAQSTNETQSGPGATAFGRGSRVGEPMLTCTEATRAAREAIMRMGYTITDVKPAKADAPGRVVAQRQSGWGPATPEGGETYTVTVTITCSDAGSEFEAVTNEGFMTRVGFPQRFASFLKPEVERKRVGPKPGAEPQGLIVNVEPVRSTTAQNEFGANLPAAGLTPVKVAIVNRSGRPYDFKRADVELITVQGSHETALPLSDATASVTRIDGTGGVQQRMREQELRDGEIGPGASLSGYLYFKAAAYRRARVVLTDVESQEEEGFSVEF